MFTAALIARLMPGPVAWLALALTASVGADLWQWRESAIVAEQRNGEIAAAEERGKRLAAEEQSSRAGRIATLAQTDNTALLQRLDAIADRAEQRRVVYRTRAVPAATCPPGAERMARSNELVRGVP